MLTLATGWRHVAESADLRLVATNGVRYATREDYPLYDLLTCVRLGITVDTATSSSARATISSSSRAAPSWQTLFAPFPGDRQALATSARSPRAARHLAAQSTAASPRVSACPKA